MAGASGGAGCRPFLTGRSCGSVTGMVRASEVTLRAQRTPLVVPPALNDCLWILLCGSVVAAALWPFQDTPFIDDWAYAWSVEHLVAGDGLRILDWSSHPNFAQVLWGALFCLPLGFSFVVLRLSTWVAALLALCGFHLLLQELGVPRRESLLGVALLGLNPVFFILSATFMTDVPFVAASLWATFALLAALRRRSDRWLVAFAVLASLASAVRVVGVVAPIAAVLTLLLHGGPWGRRKSRVALAASPLLFFALLLAWGAPRMVHVTDLSAVIGSPEFRRLYLARGLLELPRLVLAATLCAAGWLGIALLPLAAALLDRRTLVRALPYAALLLALVAVAWLSGTRWPPALAPTYTWTFGELGATESLVAASPGPAIPALVSAGVTALGFLSSALVVATLGRRLRAGESFVAWSLAGHAALLAILWLFYDRYLLVLLPLVIALVLSGRPRLERARLVALVAAFGLLSVLGVRDHLAYNRALWQGVELLHEDGVPDAQIDGGYVVDGWLQFARPEHAPRDVDDQPFFPWVNAPGGLLPYQITNEPLPGWRVLDDIPYDRWLGRSGAIYVLERDGDAP